MKDPIDKLFSPEKLRAQWGGTETDSEEEAGPVSEPEPIQILLEKLTDLIGSRYA